MMKPKEFYMNFIGFFGGHYSGPTIATKILHEGYYFPTVFQDSFKISMPLKLVIVQEPFQ